MEGAEERREVEEGGKGQAGIKLSPRLQAEKKGSFCSRLLLNSALGQRLSFWSNTKVDVPKNANQSQSQKGSSVFSVEMNAGKRQVYFQHNEGKSCNMTEETVLEYKHINII